MLEGIFARGDRSLCDVIEHAYENGARFDSWEEQLKLDVWRAAFEAFGIDTSIFLLTIPVTARLPWDHIDVGLADGFLAKEYRKSLKNRLSPPCGKTIGSFIHYTNVEAAEADKRPLVCYDCGVVCDLSQMRTERIDFLAKMGAHRRLPIVPQGEGETPAAPPQKPGSKRRPPATNRPTETPRRYRFKFEKTGPTALLGHLDLIRALPRVMRRIEVPIAYSQGFHPKPDLTFSPALSLGVLSLSEFVDMKLLCDLGSHGDPGRDERRRRRRFGLQRRYQARTRGSRHHQDRHRSALPFGIRSPGARRARRRSLASRSRGSVPGDDGAQGPT